MVFSQRLQSTCPGSMCLAAAAVIPLCCDWEAWMRMLGWDEDAGMGWDGMVWGGMAFQWSW